MRRALFATTFMAAVAWADAKHPNPFLSQAKVFFTQNEGEKCLKRLIQAEQKWKHNDKKDRAEIELFGGLCGYLVGETQAAEVSFKNSVKIDPKINLPPDVGPGIEALWTKATGKAVAMAGTGEKKDPGKTAAKTPEKQPEKTPDIPPPPPPKKEEQVARNDAPTATPLTPQPEPEPRTDAVVTKKGRNVVIPVILGAAAIGSLTAGIIFGLQAKAHETQFKSTMTFASDADGFARQARTEALLTNILFGAAGALLLGGAAVFIFTGS